MKVVGIIGSLRKESINRQVFNHYQQICAEHFELTEGEIVAIPLYNADISPQPDSVTKLAEQITQADGVLFFSPEYNYSIPGGLKNAIDWVSRCDPQPLQGKPAAIIGASPGAIGTARMQYQLRQVGVFLDIRFMNKPEVMIGQSFDKVKDDKIQDEGTIGFLAQHAQRFQKFCA